MIKDKNLKNNEQKFLSYLNGKEEFPFKGDFFKFLLISSKANRNLIENFFIDYLKDMLLYECDNYYLLIYRNKEKLEIENFIELFNEDMGTKSLIFEGFYINKDNGRYLLDFLKIIDNEYSFIKMYSKISDLILQVNNKRDVISDLKQIVLDKYLIDNEFNILVKTLFKNNLNISKTANDLYMHRNTLNNKLNSFERDTALSIQNFIDAVAIYELLK